MPREIPRRLTVVPAPGISAAAVKRELQRRSRFYEHPTNDYERGYREAMLAAIRFMNINMGGGVSKEDA